VHRHGRAGPLQRDAGFARLERAGAVSEELLEQDQIELPGLR